jgi:hypothetical protein
MRAYYITFRSVTLAQRGERILRRGGLDCTLQRTPRLMEERGCGYCLRLRPRDGIQAVELLRRDNATFSRVYALRDDGGMEELTL